MMFSPGYCLKKNERCQLATLILRFCKGKVNHEKVTKGYSQFTFEASPVFRYKKSSYRM